MNIVKNTFLTLSAGLLLTSCGEFGNVNIDPNNSSKLNTRYLLIRSEQGTSTVQYNGLYNPWEQIMPAYFSDVTNAQAGLLSQNIATVGILYRVDIANLEHIIRMATAKDPDAVQLGSFENQIAVAETLRAFFYMYLTDALGKVPYSDAIQGAQGNFHPSYDTQEFIYRDLDKRLREAFALFDTSSKLNATYDIIYRGDIAKWKKLNASLRMMMAIKLSDVAPEEGRIRFVAAYADGGIDSNADNMMRPYLAEDSYANPMHTNYVINARKGFAPSDIYINHLLALGDPRLATIADLSEANKYEGYTFGASRATAGLESGHRSLLHPNLYRKDAPAELVTATHILLIEAEAALRGWITADASTLYQKAITLAWENHGLSEAYVLPENLVAEQKDLLTPNLSVATYLAKPEVALTGNMTEDLSKIGLQRWINNFNRNGIEAWSDWRRLAVPTDIKPGPGAALDNMPQRRLYAPDDYTASKEKYNEAVADSPDVVTGRVWWDVRDNY